jgi:hypothetical protein
METVWAKRGVAVIQRRRQRSTQKPLPAREKYPLQLLLEFNSGNVPVVVV